jgi:hypothetical protein
LGDQITAPGHNEAGARKMIEYYGLDPKTPPAAIAHIDIDGILQLKQMEDLVKPIGVDITNWSMVTNGGYSHSNGLLANTALGFGLGNGYANAFFKDEPELLKRALAFHDAAINYDSDGYQKNGEELCNLIEGRMAVSKPAGPPAQQKAPAGR